MKNIFEDENEWQSEISAIQETFRPQTFKRYKPISDFPELDITIPDSVESPELAPLFDVHCGSPQQDEPLLDRHLAWTEQPLPRCFAFGAAESPKRIVVRVIFPLRPLPRLYVAGAGHALPLVPAFTFVLAH